MIRKLATDLVVLSLSVFLALAGASRLSTWNNQAIVKAQDDKIELISASIDHLRSEIRQLNAAGQSTDEKVSEDLGISKQLQLDVNSLRAEEGRLSTNQARMGITEQALEADAKAKCSADLARSVRENIDLRKRCR